MSEVAEEEKVNNVESHWVGVKFGTETIQSDYHTTRDAYTSRAVQTSPTRVYWYRSHILDLVIGSRVVVDSPITGLEIVRVVDISSKHTSTPHTKWIVDVVDLAGHEERERKRKELAAVERLVRERVNVLKEQLVWAELAKNDPVLSDLIKRSEELKA